MYEPQNNVTEGKNGIGKIFTNVKTWTVHHCLTKI